MSSETARTFKDTLKDAELRHTAGDATVPPGGCRRCGAAPRKKLFHYVLRSLSTRSSLAPFNTTTAASARSERAPRAQGELLRRLLADDALLAAAEAAGADLLKRTLADPAVEQAAHAAVASLLERLKPETVALVDRVLGPERGERR